MFQSVTLYHRTSFWGREIQGRHSEKFRGIAERVIPVQVVLDNHNDFQGCCHSHGPRVAELKETHFLKQYPGKWNLFLIERKIGKGSGGVYFLNFVMMPETFAPRLFWRFEGTLSPQTLRMELAKHFVPVLSANKAYGYPHNHIHISVVMDKAMCFSRGEWNCIISNQLLARKVERRVAVEAAAALPPSNASMVDEPRVSVAGAPKDNVRERDFPTLKPYQMIKSQLKHDLSPELKKVAAPLAGITTLPPAYPPFKNQYITKEKAPFPRSVKPPTNRSVSLSDFVVVALSKKGKQGRLLK